MPWLIQFKKNMEGKAIYVQLAQSVQKSQINNTVTSKQAYRPKKCFEFWLAMGVNFFKILQKKNLKVF